MDKNKQTNIVEDSENFLKKIKVLKLYMIEFDEFGIIKQKAYLFDFRIEENNR